MTLAYKKIFLVQIHVPDTFLEIFIKSVCRTEIGSEHVEKFIKSGVNWVFANFHIQNGMISVPPSSVSLSEKY